MATPRLASICLLQAIFISDSSSTTTATLQFLLLLIASLHRDAQRHLRRFSSKWKRSIDERWRRAAGQLCNVVSIDTQLTANGTISDGNLKFVQSSTGARGGRATIGVSSGKHYWEFTHLGGNASHGIAQNSSNLGSYPGGNDADGISWFVGGNIYRNGSTSTYAGKTYAVGDVIGTALDMDAGTVTFYKNGVSQGVAATGLTGTWFPGFGSSNVSVVSFEANFGQKPSHKLLPLVIPH